MDVKLLILLIINLAVLSAEATPSSGQPHFGPAYFSNHGRVSKYINSPASCNGVAGEECNHRLINDEEEDVDNNLSSLMRRSLGGSRYISYGALRGNNVPCNRRGSSYYNCGGGGQVNPYNRGCSAITRCARRT